MRHAAQKRTIRHSQSDPVTISKNDQADYGVHHGSDVSVQVRVWCF